jgi:hypothetical protein
MALVALSLGPLTASPQNIEEMMKWQSAEAIHYDVVAIYSGNAIIIQAGRPVLASYNGQVTDRFEIGFDWNPAGMSMVGKPTFKNFPSALPAGTPAYTVAGAQCAGPKITTPYDHVEVLDARAGVIGSNSLELSAKRRFAAGSISNWNEHGCNNWVEATASTEAVSLSMQVPLGLMLVMPPGTLPSNMTLKAPDTLVLDNTKKDGWIYRYRLRIAK